MSTMLPSGIATLLNSVLGNHPALAVISVHVAPSSVDRHTSLKPRIVLGALVSPTPPMSTMLPSGIATLLKSCLTGHSALAVISVHVAPSSVDRHTSFLKSLAPKPPISTILPSGIATLLNSVLGNHPALAVISVHGSV
jgi:hypothetical protein